MTAGLHVGKVYLRNVNHDINLTVKCGNNSLYGSLPKSKELAKPFIDVYMGNFFDLLFNGDFWETFEFCYPKLPWDVPMWLEFDKKGSLFLPKSLCEGNFLGDVEVNKTDEYINSYKFLKTF